MRKHPLAECESCPLQHERCAPTKGPENAKVALVSRSPGSYDVRNSEPFSNPKGSKKILDFLFGNNGVKREEVLLTNLVLCYSEDPPKAAINACRKRLEAEIENVDTIIAAGSEAVSEFIGKVAIAKARGLEYPRGEQRVIATNNPAAVIYDSDAFPNLVEDFQLALNPPPPIVYPKVTVYDDAKAGAKLIKTLRAIDTFIATDLEGRNDHIECAGFSWEPNSAHVLTRRAINANWDDFKSLYESEKRWLWHNGIFDCKLLRRNSINGIIVEDTYPLSYVLDEREEEVHSLKYLARTKLGWPNYVPEAVEKYFETGEVTEELYEYNGYDCAATLQLHPILEKAAHEDNTYALYKEHYIPLMNAFVEVELRGFHYDKNAAADLNEEVVLPEIRKLKRKMSKIVGLDFFNPASNPQTQAYVYGTCGLVHSLRDTRKKKFSGSFAKEVRKEITDGRFDCKPKFKSDLLEFTELYEVWAQIDKQRGTYIEGLIKLVGEDGKLYCSFNPCGTVTGRISSRRPNFQNITRTERNVVPAIRTLFKPSPGNVIVQADYSQAELRCIAKFSGDTELLSIYRDTKRSLHKETASAFYGENYTKDQYVKSKNINFGVCYGQSAFAFAQMYHMPQEEAQAYIDAWFKKFPRVAEWIVETHKTILKENYVVNPFGRKRRFYLITDENVGDILREGVNTIPQGTASDFTAEALVELNATGLPVISTVHDSILADVPAKEAKEAAILMKEVMERMPAEKLGWDDIPFLVDIAISDQSWGQVEEMELLAA